MKKLLITLLLFMLFAAGYSQTNLGYGTTYVAVGDSLNDIVTTDTTAATAFTSYMFRFPSEDVSWSLQAGWWGAGDTAYIYLKGSGVNSMFQPISDTIPILDSIGKGYLSGTTMPFTYVEVYVLTDTSNVGTYDILWTIKKQ